MDEELDSVDYTKRKKTRKRKFKDIDEKITNHLDPRKTKMVVEFNNRESTSIKYFAFKKRTE